MPNVSTNGIKGCAAEISNVINITTSIADKVQAACSDISNANSMLKSYNGAVVKGTREDKTTKNSDGLNIKQTYANFWKITGLGGDGNVSVLNEMANEVSNIVSTVKSEVASIEEIATAIDGYIGSINAKLSDLDIRSITPEILANAYLAIGKDGVAKANLATSGEDINNRNFINYSDIKDNGLSNTRLTFVLQDDGSYRVYSNGKETEFYTTGLAAAFYQKTLKREVQKTYSSKSGNNQTNSSKSGNRNIGTKNTDNTKTLPDGSIQKTSTAKDGSKKIEINGSFDGKSFFNKDGENITPSNDLLQQIEKYEKSKNISSTTSIEVVKQDGSITKYYYDIRNNNKLVNVCSFNKTGTEGGSLDINKCKESFSKILSSAPTGHRLYLDSNGDINFTDMIFKE